MRKMIMMLTVLTCLALSASAWPPPDCTGKINYCAR